MSLIGAMATVAVILSLGALYHFTARSNYLAPPLTENQRFLKELESARKGDAEAKYQLGLKYKNGDGITPMRAEAIKWLTKAAESGHAKAQLELGMLYFGYVSNDDVLDFKQAGHWLQQAAEQGEVDAQYVLGEMYADGRGVIQDYVQAATWLKRAAQAGHLDAMYSLGMMYVAGNGVPEDLIEAYVWFNLAAAQNNQTAIIAREKVAELLNPEQLAQGQARSRSWAPSTGVAPATANR